MLEILLAANREMLLTALCYRYKMHPNTAGTSLGPPLGGVQKAGGTWNV
jgi:hypothetical protein